MLAKMKKKLLLSKWPGKPVLRATRELLELTSYQIPKWYGVAWHDYDTDVVVFMWIPLNIFAGWWQRLKWLCKKGVLREIEITIYKKSYKEGYDKGYQEGFNKGYGVYYKNK